MGVGFSPSTIWVLGIGLRPWGLAANTFTCWINLSAYHPPTSYLNLSRQWLLEKRFCALRLHKLIESNPGPLCKVLVYFCILKSLVSSDRFRTSGFTLKPLTYLGLIFVQSKRSVCPVPLIYTWISGFSITISPSLKLSSSSLVILFLLLWPTHTHGYNFIFRFTYDIQHMIFEYGSFHFDVR